ncbi:MAG: hypothetical protein Q8O14_04715 [bacterium]|nr:hypothetical protein [bacterium]
MWGLALRNGRAYVANGEAGLRVFDVGDPAHPVELGVFNAGDRAKSVAVRDSLAFVVDDRDGLRVLDIRRLDQIQEAGYYKTPGRAIGVGRVDEVVLVADLWAGVLAIRYKGSTPVAPPQPARPAKPALSAAPNPFNPVTTIRCTMPAAQWASLRVHDLDGRLVKALASGWHTPGEHGDLFDGGGLASGVYRLN